MTLMYSHCLALFNDCGLYSRRLQAVERVQEVEAKWITDKAALDRRLKQLLEEKSRLQLEYESQSW